MTGSLCLMYFRNAKMQQKPLPRCPDTRNWDDKIALYSRDRMARHCRLRLRNLDIRSLVGCMILEQCRRFESDPCLGENYWHRLDLFCLSKFAREQFHEPVLQW